ncbi:MAG: hypothetical protein KME07_01475 [Pegethrix bostrychoides GSE-TBD4-15B]|uniref:DUF4239 domain-containing protein n=1 Tax=Pegethrix bostrychoides GSE-TBD4-15B TaxID=2839662 RepID=A0A951P7U5_9CYAN|nr:hypothetical protein [Pegethrix bostrychoides GSE-TBD4-15B]
MPQSIYLKWGILLKVLPFTLLFCGVKWGIHMENLELWKFDRMTGSLFGAATFVIAFILSGTLADYRISEDLVCQLASAVESIQDTAFFAAVNHETYDSKPLTQTLTQILERFLDWLKDDAPALNFISAIEELNLQFASLEPHVSGPVLSRVQSEQAKLRFITSRMKLIRDTEFIPPAYVLLNLFLVGAVIALLLTSGDQFSKTLVVSGFLFTSFLYLVALIRNLDNPFRYGERSCLAVDLMLLDGVLDRLRANLQHQQIE